MMLGVFHTEPCSTDLHKNIPVDMRLKSFFERRNPSEEIPFTIAGIPHNLKSWSRRTQQHSFKISSN